jgi:hypothetical protein
MLHLETVEPRTFSLLKKLQALPELKEFSLVGGTALSLRYGHRISVDLDLFGNTQLDKEPVINILEKTFGQDFTYTFNKLDWAIFCFIQNIKVDIIRYNHPIIAPIETIEGINLYSKEDIIAMKLNAVLGRGMKKDFWDIYELLHHFTLEQMIDFHFLKFPKQMLAISIPEALCYFNDADESEDPISLKGQTWNHVKLFIREKVSEYLS